VQLAVSPTIGTEPPLPHADTVAPSTEKVTSPLGVGEPPVTVAVYVTLWLVVGDAGEDERSMFGKESPVAETTSVDAAPLAAYVASPE
jgi:hypothetical protein